MELICLKRKKYIYIFTLWIIIILFASIKVGRIMDIYNSNFTTFYVHSENKMWGDETKLNIFGSSNKIIYPGKTGIYKFYVQNDENVSHKYKILFSESTNLKLKMMYRFRSEADYIAGVNGKWSSLGELKSDYLINKKSTNKYILEWKFMDNYNLNSGYYTLDIKVING